MRVALHLFASYADALGTRSLDVSLPDNAIVRDALEYVRALPGAQSLPPQPLVAVNAEYAPLDRPLKQGDEVALIPPVAGG
ncbi:MAG TPA: MoaD/ThiS family protein [Gemmatimonadaceae bacterium]|nr:MoaD/ThiS family protein [Gemmatimonadaceae bacterium]